MKYILFICTISSRTETFLCCMLYTHIPRSRHTSLLSSYKHKHVQYTHPKSLVVVTCAGTSQASHSHTFTSIFLSHIHDTVLVTHMHASTKLSSLIVAPNSASCTQDSSDFCLALPPHISLTHCFLSPSFISFIFLPIMSVLFPLKILI